MRRAFIVVAALAMAITTALGVMCAALLIVGAAQAGARGVTAAFLDVALAFAWSDQPARTAALALRAAVTTLALICCAPVIFTALIGEIAGLRSFLWYGGATALLACALPLASRGPVWAPASSQPSAFVPLLLSGVSAGLVYWLVAGRDGGAPSRAAPRAGADFDLAPRDKSGIDQRKT